MPHYFDDDPDTASRPARVTLAGPVALTLHTDAGVFSPRRVDPGTRLLLQIAPLADTADLPAGDLVDVGCGYGPIAVSLAVASPSRRIWAVDTNGRARDLCRANATEAGCDNVTVVAPEEVPPELTVAGIWSNPPIRIGKQAMHRLIESWLDRVVPGGRAWLVVQKHLGADSLAAHLDHRGHPTRRLASRQGYRVLEVAGPDRGATE